MVSVKWG